MYQIAPLTPANFDVLFSRVRHLGGTAKAGPSDIAIRCNGPQRHIVMTYGDRYVTLTSDGDAVTGVDHIFDRRVAEQETDWDSVVSDLENRMGPQIPDHYVTLKTYQLPAAPAI